MDTTKSPEKMDQIVGKDATNRMDQIASNDQTHPPSFYQKRRDDEDAALLVAGEDILLLVLGCILPPYSKVLAASVRQEGIQYGQARGSVIPHFLPQASMLRAVSLSLSTNEYHRGIESINSILFISLSLHFLKSKCPRSHLPSSISPLISSICRTKP
ncbi:hypothetical protein L6452_01444 [Arctium lappa]|uniref:Uncharacterized protein n=1 Tax=Arctium lappa TaxID=4217 RepID=A0ACB9FH49_ARCLA|nr:hypothetical protein L6452_01444 [Arctium lappa]